MSLVDDTAGRVVSAAEQLLARGAPVRLGNVAVLTEQGRRNALLRCQNLSSGDPASVVLKVVVAEHYDPDDSTSWDVARFFSDWAGLEFLSSLPETSCCAPRFLGGDRALGFVAMEDLGTRRSLVEPLLDEEAASAESALRSFGSTLGKLHAATIGHSAVFERICQRLHRSAVHSGHAVTRLGDAVTRLPGVFERLGVPVDAGFHAELQTVLDAMVNPGAFHAYIHGDPCPDNVVLVDDHVRLIDFEFGRFGHALLDAAYARMMFPTCWCATRLPPRLVALTERAYRAELVGGCPQAADDRVFEPALSRACAFWALNTVDRHLEGALEQDRQWGISTMRPRVLARLEGFVTTAEAFDQLPALRGAANRLLAVLRQRWPDTSSLPIRDTSG